nr:peptidase [Acidobacteriota bacterium]
MKNLLIAVLLFSVATSAFASAHLIIRNTNAAGVGFNDSTAATPVAGNAGTTLGQQRLNTFQRAADIWGSLIDSRVDILVDASFASLDCSATSAVLGQASSTRIVRNFDNAPQQDVWYPIALANAIAGKDLASGSAHIRAQFNSQLDTPNCFGGAGWYYGFDGNHGAKEDLIVVLLHELGHGLGFAGVTSGTTGAMSQNFPSVFEQHMLDASGLHWNQMSNVQRIASATNDQNVAWDGASATAAAAKFLGGTPTLRISAPPSLVKPYQINTAS